MPIKSQVELRDFKVAAQIGSYGPDDVVPSAHMLDLILQVSPSLVFVDADDMSCVFDYDPLIAQINSLATSLHYQTQERLMTQIVEVCSKYLEIETVEVYLRKFPVLAGTGTLGLRLIVEQAQLSAIRGVA